MKTAPGKWISSLLALITLLTVVSGILVPSNPTSASTWTPLKMTDALIHEPRGTADGVYALAVALGSYRLKDVRAYVDEIYRLAPLVGLDPAILIGQSALETGYWKGKFWKSSLNPAGIGIYDDYQPHSFYWATGTNAARGHIYHLYTYARGVPLPGHVLHQFRSLTPGVDGVVRLGFAGTKRTIWSLQGSWALMDYYALGLCNKGNEILKFTESIQPKPTETNTAAPLPEIGVSASAGNDPSVTLDGNGSTSWAILGRGSIPVSGYVTYNLGTRTQLASIEWKFRKAGFADSLSIRGSLDGETWTTLRLFTQSPDTSWQRLSVNMTYRYIRFVFKNPNRDADIGYLAEVRLNGYRTPTPTLTPTTIPTRAFLTGAPMTPISSGGSGGASPSKNVRDGSLDSDWRTLTTPAPRRAFVYLDLGGQAEITGVRWFLFAANCGYDMVIESSRDKQIWTEIGRSHPHKAGVWHSFETRATARYVRLLFLNDGTNPILGCLSEMQVWGTGVTIDTPTATSSPSLTPTSTETPKPIASNSPEPSTTFTIVPTLTSTVVQTETESPVPTETPTDLPSSQTPLPPETSTPVPSETAPEP